MLLGTIWTNGVTKLCSRVLLKVCFYPFPISFVVTNVLAVRADWQYSFRNLNFVQVFLRIISLCAHVLINSSKVFK